MLSFYDIRIRAYGPRYRALPDTREARGLFGPAALNTTALLLLIV